MLKATLTLCSSQSRLLKILVTLREERYFFSFGRRMSNIHSKRQEQKVCVSHKREPRKDECLDIFFLCLFVGYSYTEKYQMTIPYKEVIFF